MIAFSCQKCGKQFSLKPEFAGRTTTCSGCKQPLVVPAQSPSSEAAARIAFSCMKCGMKFDVSAEFAGRKTTCPTCKTALVVPSLELATVALPAAGNIDGLASSLARAKVDAEVTLAGSFVTENTALNSPPTGTSADGTRYRIENELARGGMGAVLRAIDCDIRREVAVKYLLDQTNTKNKVRFVEEAQITGQLEHPNIVPIHELGVDAQQRIFFTMKMVKGRSLAQIINLLRDDPAASDVAYPLHRLLNIFVSVCNALAYAHSRGVVHRDLKPANVMVGDFGEVYVMDWGLAKVLGRPSSAMSVADEMTIPEAQIAEVPSATLATSLGSGNVVTSREADADLTQAGAVMGTPVYMPPEQAAGRIDEIDERSDIYSMGAILYELLTLQAPIDKTGGFWPIVMRVGQGKIDAPEQRSPERARAGKIPPELAAIAMKALAKEKRDRYQSIETLRKDIERFTEGRSVSAKHDTIREMAVKLVKRNRGVSIATASAAVILAVVGVWSLIAVLAANSRTLAEQTEKVKRTKEAIPAFLKAARQAIQQSEFDDALTQAKVALDYDPDNAEALLLNGQLLVSRKELAAARKELAAYVRMRPDDADAKRLESLCSSDISNPSVQEAIAQVLVAQKQLTLAVGLLQENEKRIAIYRKKIAAAWPASATSLKFDSNHRLSYYLRGKFIPNTIMDLTPLQGIPISDLVLYQLLIADLRPLRGMPLTNLQLTELENLKDIPDLGQLPLTTLEIVHCERLENLTGLKGLPISTLKCNGCRRLKDISPLRGLPILNLSLNGTEISDIEALQGMKLRTLNLNNNNKLKNLSPLKDMKLVKLSVSGTAVDDISLLREMPLEELHVGSAVTDLSPLKAMPLKNLVLSRCQVSQIDVLKGMQLQKLDLSLTKVKDLKLLQGQPLEELNLNSTAVSDLSPLKNMPLKKLDLVASEVADLLPLVGMKDLKKIQMSRSKVRDVTPLKGMKLVAIDLPIPIQFLQGLEVLREMDSLQSISVDGTVIRDFWQKLDKGEIK